MKFKFCGDQDCPDWLLAEMMTLSRLTSVKTKLVSLEVIRSMIPGNPQLNQSKVGELCQDGKLGESDVQATCAALSFIFRTSAKNLVNQAVLQAELQQLGLPKEHATAIGRVYSDHMQQLSDMLISSSLRLSRHVSIKAWSKVKCVSSQESEPLARITLSFVDRRGEPQEQQLTVSHTQLQTLMLNLRRAQTIMSPLLPD